MRTRPRERVGWARSTAWAIAAATSGLLAWALFRLVRRRTAQEQASREPLGEHLGDIAEPSSDWNVPEREIWLQVEAIAQATPPFNFTEIEPFIASAHQTITAVARSFHPEQTETLTEFTLPEVLLLTERVSRRLRGKEIPVEGRVMAVVDVYDAITTRTLYRPTISHEQAVQFIIERASTHFDPAVVDAFLRVAPNFKEVRAENER